MVATVFADMTTQQFCNFVWESWYAGQWSFSRSFAVVKGFFSSVGHGPFACVPVVKSVLLCARLCRAGSLETPGSSALLAATPWIASLPCTTSWQQASSPPLPSTMCAATGQHRASDGRSTDSRQVAQLLCRCFNSCVLVHRPLACGPSPSICGWCVISGHLTQARQPQLFCSRSTLRFTLSSYPTRSSRGLIRVAMSAQAHLS